MTDEKIDTNVDPHRDHEHAEFDKVIGSIDDPVLLILRVHLYAEHLLERFISSRLPRGDRLMNDGNLSFNQKLSLAASFDYIPDELITSLKQLNRVRNQCAHELHKSITISDVDKIGNPFGAKYTDIRRNNVGNAHEALNAVFLVLCAGVAALTHRSEEEAQKFYKQSYNKSLQPTHKSRS